MGSSNAMEMSYDVDRDHLLEEIRVASARVVAETRFGVLRIGGGFAILR